MEKSFWNIIEESKKNKWPVCIYGLGRITTRCLNDIVGILNVEPDYYSDRNQEVLEGFDCSFCRALSLNDIINCKNDMLVIIMMGNASIASAYDSLQNNDFLHLISFQEISSDSRFLSSFFGLSYLPAVTDSSNISQMNDPICNSKYTDSTKKIAIYTCITNDYDDPPNISYLESNVDYFLITDKKYEEPILNGFKVINVDDCVPLFMTNPKDINRYCKSHGAKIFKKYDFSIYFDGNIDIVGPITNCISLAQKSGLAFHKHPFVSDAYHELFRVYAANRISKSESIATAKWLFEEGYPRNVLCLDCNVIVCDNRNSFAVNLLDEWFRLYMSGAAKRDQIYMSYLLWKKKIGEDDIGIIAGTVDGDDGFVQRRCTHKL